MFRYKNASGAVVFAWHIGNWFNWMWEVEAGKVVRNSSSWVVHNNSNNVFGLATNRQSNAAVAYLGQFPTADDCFTACNKSAATGVPCETWTWHHTDFPQTDWAQGCYSRRDGVFAPATQDGVTSAQGPVSAYSMIFGKGRERKRRASGERQKRIREERDLHLSHVTCSK